MLPPRTRDTDIVLLVETIPQPLGLADALKRRETKEKELLEPLLSTPQPSIAIAVSFPQSLSITLPPASSRSVPGSASASNAPSPRPSVQSISQASASTSKTTGGKPKRKSKLMNGDVSASAHGNGNAASAVVNGHGTASAAPQVTAVDTASNTMSAAPSAPVMPRRQSLREPKPRRRPDGQEVPPRPAPPPPSPVKGAKDILTADGQAKPTVKGGKAKVPRAKTAKGKKAGVSSVVDSEAQQHTVTSSVSAPAKNGVSHTHLHANGNGARVTRSRRGSAAVVQPSTPDVASSDAGSRPDDAKWSPPERSSGFTGPGSVSLDSPAPPFGGFNPGRTIYSQQRSAR